MQLVIKNMEKGFDNKRVLKGINFTFEKGKIYGLLGRNGAGKTTFFNCLSEELSWDSGEAFLQSQEGDRDRIPLTADDIGYVFSTPILPEFLTGYEFVKFFIDINKGKVDQGIDEYFDMVKIDPEDRHRLIKGYSHGMKSKLQMLCFIISKPLIVLLDEPLTSFDVVVALEMKKLLRNMKSEHILIFSTHILQLATDLCDEIVVLSKGRLQQIEQDENLRLNFEERIVEMLAEEEKGEGANGS